MFLHVGIHTYLTADLSICRYGRRRENLQNFLWDSEAVKKIQDDVFGRGLCLLQEVEETILHKARLSSEVFWEWKSDVETGGLVGIYSRD